MYVLRDKRLAFLAHPRTASQATAEALRGLGFEPVGAHHEYDASFDERLKARWLESKAANGPTCHGGTCYHPDADAVVVYTETGETWLLRVRRQSGE